jgi:hypothetical protein
VLDAFLFIKRIQGDKFNERFFELVLSAMNVKASNTLLRLMESERRYFQIN